MRRERRKEGKEKRVDQNKIGQRKDDTMEIESGPDAYMDGAWMGGWRDARMGSTVVEECKRSVQSDR